MLNEENETLKKKVIVGLSLSPETIKAIEEKRRKENRSSFIDTMIKGCLGVKIYPSLKI
jgi:hypothetical protein